jgi:predicted TPR repeat methyltransferase
LGLNVSLMALTLSTAEATTLAREHLQAGRAAEAEALCEKVVEAAPDDADSWNFLGVLRFHRGDRAGAIEAAEKAVALAPDYADAHANLGIILTDQADLERAEAHLKRAIDLQPDAVPPRLTMASVLRQQNRMADAEWLLRDILAVAPDHPSAHHSLAGVLMMSGRTVEGLQHFRRAVADPRMAALRVKLAGELARNGLPEEAARQLRETIAQNPDDLAARHLLAAYEGASPARSDENYVRKLFDHFADSFDADLAGLDYRAPQLIAGATELCLGAAAGALAVLDAGCGTGLMGPLIRPWARELDGVDLSAGMLARARGIACYDRLVEGELTAFLASAPAAYDLITCADTLCYFGELETVCRAAAASLRAPGWFIFSVERADQQEEGYRLHVGGRYAHRADYVENALNVAGFDEVRMAREALRLQRGVPVAGLIVAARKT